MFSAPFAACLFSDCPPPCPYLAYFLLVILALPQHFQVQLHKRYDLAAPDLVFFGLLLFYWLYNVHVSNSSQKFNHRTGVRKCQGWFVFHHHELTGTVIYNIVVELSWELDSWHWARWLMFTKLAIELRFFLKLLNVEIAF